MDQLETRSATRTVLPRGLTYFEYQRLVCSEVVIPWLSAHLDLTGLEIADLGAHQGGMVDALRESGVVSTAIGLELSSDIVSSSPFVGDERFRLEVADVTALTGSSTRFDLVLMHDVLEHIPQYASALRAAASVLRPKGRLFVSFPPYYSSFGGHQQLAAGRARVVPFLHLLPDRAFVRLARPSANEYMSAQNALADMVSVRGTRLTLAGAEEGFFAAGLEVEASDFYLVRPEYTVRYGVKSRRARVLGRVPLLRELAVNGAFFLLRARASVGTYV